MVKTRISYVVFLDLVLIYQKLSTWIYGILYIYKNIFLLLINIFLLLTNHIRSSARHRRQTIQLSPADSIILCILLGIFDYKKKVLQSGSLIMNPLGTKNLFILSGFIISDPDCIISISYCIIKRFLC